MRTYYGELSDCLKYIEDKNHKAIPLKDDEFSFEFHNSTNYTLVLKRRTSDYSRSITTVRPKEKIQIHVEKWGNGGIFVYAKENNSLQCMFRIEQGCMIERSLEEPNESKVCIVPVFKNGIVTIVECEDGGPNFGKKPKYKITPLKEPAKTIKVCNYSPYDIIISTENTVIQRIRGWNRSKKCPSGFIGIPLSGVIYIDTVFEEIAWKSEYATVYEDARILRVNGCCIKVKNGIFYEDVTITGPGLAEPYIRHLDVNFKKIWMKDSSDINVYCDTIDYSLE